MKPSLEVVELNADHIDEIMGLERKVCIPPIQAAEDTILGRFKVGNFMVGVRLEGRLVGSIGFRHGTFLENDLGSFPSTFREFSTPSAKPFQYNAGFVYSVNVDPDHRTLVVPSGTAGKNIGIGKALVMSMLDLVKKADCSYLVGDGRPAFYNGSFDFPQERYEQDPRLRKLLDTCAGRRPSDDESAEILAYPIFKGYDKSVGGGLKVAWVLSDFFPNDPPSGGFRVILYKWLRPL